MRSYGPGSGRVSRCGAHAMRTRAATINGKHVRLGWIFEGRVDKVDARGAWVNIGDSIKVLVKGKFDSALPGWDVRVKISAITHDPANGSYRLGGVFPTGNE